MHDDDEDGLIDEDLPNDICNDFAPGIYLIDDDGDGLVDEDSFFEWNDDETLTAYNEDPIDGIDNDGDNNIDEDPGEDNNADGCSGICGVDDDVDGSVDEANVDDDDEDGQQNEDWYNVVVFYLDNGVLKERMSVPWDESGSRRYHWARFHYFKSCSKRNALSCRAHSCSGWCHTTSRYIS